MHEGKEKKEYAQHWPTLKKKTKKKSESFSLCLFKNLIMLSWKWSLLIVLIFFINFFLQPNILILSFIQINSSYFP